MLEFVNCFSSNVNRQYDYCWLQPRCHDTPLSLDRVPSLKLELKGLSSLCIRGITPVSVAVGTIKMPVI